MQMSVEKIRGGVVGSKPVRMRQEIVDLVGENDLLKFHALFA